MDRPMRTRRLPQKFLDNVVVVEAATTKTSNKVAKRSDDDRESAAVPKIQLAKGNLLAGKKSVARRPRSPVLRDRTNLPEEPLKVDILVKKGADDKTRATKVPKATRQTAKSAAATEENEAEAPGRAKSLRPRAKTLTTEKENSEKAPEMKAKTKEKTTKAQATEEAKTLTTEKENSDKAPEMKAKTKEKTTKAQATAEAKNAPPKEKAKKAKTTKAAAPLDDQENSLVIESENAAEVENAPKVRPTRSGPKKIGKRVVASSRLSTSRQTKLIVDKRAKKSLSGSPAMKKKAETATKTNVESVKKFFKTRTPGAIVKKSEELPVRKMVTKRREIVKKSKPTVSTSFRLRQTTLSESFAKQALKKALRPRTAQRNYRERTILEKTTEDEKVKGPVYKTAKLLEKSDDDASEVYEFQFDKNDSRERIPKKKRKRKVDGVAPRKTRAKAVKKTSAKPKAVADNAKNVDEAAAEPRPPEFPAAFDEPMETNDVPAINSDSPITTRPIQPKKIEPQAPRVESQKPRILESVKLTGEKQIELTTTPQLAKSGETNIRPPRLTLGRSTVQYKTMLKHVLLNRSLSPIKKALENFDPGSPWRPPIIPGLQFSRVKNVVQSTPQARTFSARMENKNGGDSTSEPTRMKKIDENKDIAKPANQLSPLKASGLAKSPRKFGTVISNVNVSSPAIQEISASPAIQKISENQGSPRKMENVESPRIVDPSISRISDGYNDVDNFDHTDKENSVPAPTSPKKVLKSPTKMLKSPTKTLTSPRKLDIRRFSPLRPFNRAKATTKENLEPQPGPSGLQKRSPLGESRILKQSNLHNFLNMDELPTSTRIATAHSIFADAHSTPIPGKPVKMIAKEANVENAFGFDEGGDSDIELSPIKNSLFADPPTAAKNIVPTRFSIGEIKKHLRPIVAKDKKEEEDDPVKRIEAAEKENREGKKENREVGDKANFTDTFDVMTAAEENAKETVTEVPLFADLEPVHFKQPPRHSYKRKRIAFNFSEDEDNDAESSFTEHDNRGTKKRKVSKVEKQQKKKLDEWAKNLNNTFEEIDHFDLVVE